MFLTCEEYYQCEMSFYFDYEVYSAASKICYWPQEQHRKLYPYIYEILVCCGDIDWLQHTVNLCGTARRTLLRLPKLYFHDNVKTGSSPVYNKVSITPIVVSFTSLTLQWWPWHDYPTKWHDAAKKGKEPEQLIIHAPADTWRAGKTAPRYLYRGRHQDARFLGARRSVLFSHFRFGLTYTTSRARRLGFSRAGRIAISNR